MRIRGRHLRASSLAERRVLKALGVDALRVPRHLNIFMVARQIRRLALGRRGDLTALQCLLTVERAKPAVRELPDSTSAPPAAERAA